jgi:hypothetical protein
MMLILHRQQRNINVCFGKLRIKVMHSLKITVKYIDVTRTLIDTDGWMWFNHAREGDGAHTIISAHYRGTAETKRRAAEAESMLERLHYKSEASFSFEHYVIKMNECFELMDNNDQALAEAQKVKKLLNGVKSTHPEINALKTVVRATYPTDLNAATTLMAGQIAAIFPAASFSYDQRPKRKISAASANRASRGCFGRKQGPMPIMANGVHITDPNRSFTSDEWSRLRQSGLLSWIIERRATNDRARCNGGSRTGHQGGRGSRGGRTQMNAPNDRVVAAVEQQP